MKSRYNELKTIMAQRMPITRAGEFQDSLWEQERRMVDVY